MTKQLRGSTFPFIHALIPLVPVVLLTIPTFGQQVVEMQAAASQQAQESTSPAAQDQQPGKDEKAQEGTGGQQQGGADQKSKKYDRMFFVMPNYLTVRDEAKVEPLTRKEKFKVAAKGAFDPYEFVIVGVLSGIRQATNSYPSFGQGAEGYGKRYGAAFADQVDGNIMVGAVYPSILRTDPRYYQLGKGGFCRRFLYAFSRIFVTRKDSVGNIFNIPEFAGNASAIGISTLYYPSQDRTSSSFISGWGVQMGIDAFGNELKEFWPDIHRMISKRKQGRASP